jgi:hypothetical protein
MSQHLPFSASSRWRQVLISCYQDVDFRIAGNHRYWCPLRQWRCETQVFGVMPSQKGVASHNGEKDREDNSMDNVVRAEEPPKTSPEYEIEAIIEEYKSLQEQTNVRITNQQQIINFAIGLIAAIIALMQFLPNISTYSLARPAYLLASLMFSAFALMFIEQDVLVRAFGIYIETNLRPRMEHLLGEMSNTTPKIWQWDEFRRKTQFRPLRTIPFYASMTISRYAIIIAPSLVFLIVYWVIRNSIVVVSTWENILFGLAGLAVLWVFFTLAFSTKLYADDLESRPRQRIR